MSNIQNFTGYCLIYRDAAQVPPSELSTIQTGAKWEQWQTLIPLVIYPTVEMLIEAVPDFDKRKHIIGEVIVHLIGERVEILTVKFPGEA